MSFGLVFATVWRGRRGDDYLLHWSASSLLYGAVLFCFDLTRGEPPIVTSVLLGLLGFTDVLLLSGVRRFRGLPPFRAWMAAPILTSMMGHDLPTALAAIGWLPAGRSIVGLGECLGLAATVIIVGVAILRGDDRATPDGRLIVGGALLAYVPAYLLAAAGELGIAPHSSLLPVLPMIADQALLGVLNLGLLAMQSRRAQAELRDRALRDPLTGTWNRAGMKALEGRLLSPGAAVIAIDVDHFKAINDAYGHAAGDEVLATVADEIGRCARAVGGELARVGGDEFLVLLPATPEGAAFFAERMRVSVVPGDRPGPEWTLSVGVSSVDAGEDSFAPAKRRADACLYRAKADGRDRVAA